MPFYPGRDISPRSFFPEKKFTVLGNIYMYRNVEKFRGHGKFDIIVDFIFEKLVSMDHFVSVFFI